MTQSKLSLKCADVSQADRRGLHPSEDNFPARERPFQAVGRTKVNDNRLIIIGRAATEKAMHLSERSNIKGSILTIGCHRLMASGPLPIEVT